ncbi:MAG: hypothetical protein ACR2RE_02175 [Geminicoccaceae bacterium]
MPTVLFRTYAPDQAEHIPDILRQALNVFPTGVDFRVMNSFEGVTDPLPGTPLGISSVRDVNDASLVFAGDESELYSLSGINWSAIGRALGYSVASDGRWEFAPYEQLVAATNGNDLMQISNAAGSQFEDLVDQTDPDNYTDEIVPNGGLGDPDSPTFIAPVGKTMATIGSFLVIGNFFDNQNGELINAVRWSRSGDPRKWKIDPTFQTNIVNIQAGGPVQRVVASGEYGVVFQENQIGRLDLSEGIGFAYTATDQRRGALMAGGVIPHGRRIFFSSNDGFFIFNGVDSEPIGDGRIDRRFRDFYDNANRRRVSGAIDEENKLAIWSVPFNTGGDTPNRLFMYHWPSGEWSESDEAVSILVSLETTGISSDDPVFGQEFTDTGAFAETLSDSPLFRGGELRFAAFDTNRRLAFNNGAKKPSLIQTSDIQLNPRQRSLLTKVRPIFDTEQGLNTPTVRAGGRDTHRALTSFNDERPVLDDGECPVRRENRYHQFIVQTPNDSDIDHITGVAIEAEDFVPVGER